MKNLKKLSRKQLQIVSGGVEANCHCHGVASKNIPPMDYVASSAESCFKMCDQYRSSFSKSLSDSTS